MKESVLISILITVIIISISISNTVKGQNNISDQFPNYNDSKTINISNFSLGYTSKLVAMTDNGPKFNFTVFIVASPEILEKIQKVNYFAFPKFEGPNTYNGTLSQNVTTEKNKFSLNLNVFAGPRINATVYFKDGEIIKYPKTLFTYTPCPIEICPIGLQVQPTLNGSIIKLDGYAIEKKGNISSINIDWGDGISSLIKNNTFSISHSYSKINFLKIIITAVGERQKLVESIECGKCGVINPGPIESKSAKIVKANEFIFGIPQISVAINILDNFLSNPTDPNCIINITRCK